MHHATPKIVERSGAVTFALAATLVTTACHLGGQSFDDGRDGLDGVSTRRDHAELAEAAANSSGELCTQMEDRFAAATYDEQRTRVQGRWLLCSGPAVFDGEFLDGIDVNADGSWSLLRFDEAGELQPQAGHAGERTWGVFNPTEGSDEFELSLGQANAAMFLTTSFWNEGTRMKLHPSNSIGLTTGDAAGDYQLLTEPLWQPEMVADDAGSQPSGAEVCALEEEAEWISEIIEQEEYIRHVIGRWVYCSGAINVAPQDGIEISADGTWSLLRYDEAGALVSQDAPELSGIWVVNDVTGAGGQFEFIFKDTAGGFYSSSLGFSENPALMHMDTPEGLTLFARE